jgi:hypothetical protein
MTASRLQQRLAPVLATLVSTAFVGCAATGGAPSAVPQGDLMSKFHPSTAINYRIAAGDEKLEVNNAGLIGGGVSPSVSSGASALFHQLQLEHYFESQLGVAAGFESGSADDILEDLGASSSGIDTTYAHIALAYRTTIDDDFRIPVQFGPYIHEATIDGFAGGDIDYSTLGLRLAAAPEVILMQRERGSRMSELSLFVAFSVGAGATDVENSSFSETGYAFHLGGELGVKYRFGFPFEIGLSGIYRKSNYGLTDSHEDTVFFGIDDDFTGVGLTLGSRF